MLLIVGLGNIGKQYANTRHNVGFKAVDAISSRLSFCFSPNSKFKSDLATGDFLGKKIILCKPTTYMNLSGEAVGAISHYYKIPLENIIVIHDDIDLKLGDIRVKRGGGHAGHNGLRSIDSHVSKDYWRVRVGVGRPDNREDVADYVLTNFTKDEVVVMDEALCDVAAKVEVFINGELE